MIDSGEFGEKKNLLGDEKGTAKYVNHVEDITGKDFIANIFEYEYEKIMKKTKKMILLIADKLNRNCKRADWVIY